MHSKEPALSSPLRAIWLAMVAAFVMTTTVVSAFAQNSVPPTAVQAAKMPQFASRLGHPAQRRLPPPKSQVFARAKAHRGPLDNSDIYDNGPANGNADAWTINFGFIVSDTFTVANDNTPITGMSFGAWVFPGDTLTSAELSITSSENGGTSYFDQTVNFTQGSCTANNFGFNVCTETASFTGPTLNAGTYWVNLQNATTPAGNPIYWDENSGVGCTGTGCPSLASQNSVGSIPSESFTILGSATTTTTTTTYDDACPFPLPNGFHDLHEFGQDAGPSGLAIDRAGKLYGALANGGRHGAGLLYDLTQRAGHWFSSSLYSFLGGSSGSSPNSVIIGPGGAIFGSAASDLQNCDGSNCGLIYRASPGPTACATALCSWDEATIYQFNGNTDAWEGSVSAYDSAGNLYGISFWGGAYGYGALFELSPTQGGWTETILHSFTGGSDGARPTSLLMGQDGNLYGTATAGGTYGYGLVFQFVPSGGSWTENIIYAFTGSATDGWGPGGLIQDGQGSFYGFGQCSSYGYGYCNDGGDWNLGVIFSLSRSGDGWGLTQLHVYSNGECPISNGGHYNALAIGPAGDLYATESAGIQYFCSGVLDVRNGWVVVWGPFEMFSNLTADANGNLYGTSPVCGYGTHFRGNGRNGMLWQYSP